MPFSKIIIAVDGSKYAERAAKFGFDIARKFNAAVGLVNIIEPVITSIDASDSILGMPLANAASLEETDLINAQTEYSKNIIRQVMAEHAGGLDVKHFSEYGSTADGILECSIMFGADLIVVGTHKRSGFERLLEGSTAESVIRRSEIPVLVVPFPEAD